MNPPLAITSAETLVWRARAQLSVRLLWAGRHDDMHARERIHACVRVLRLIQGHHYRPHAAVMTCDQIGAAIEALMERRARGAVP